MWCSPTLRVYGCVFCCISLLPVYMRVCMPISWRSIAGVPSSKQTNLLITKYMIHDKIQHIRKINNKISPSNITFITSQTTSAHVHVCYVLLSPFACIFAYALVYFKTICECIIKSTFIGPRSIAGVPSSQAAPSYLITAHHLCASLLYLAR